MLQLHKNYVIYFINVFVEKQDVLMLTLILYPYITENFCSRSRHVRKITTGICLIFRGLFSEHNPREIGPHYTGQLKRLAKKPFMDGH
jgi:hypothetical protein